MAVLNRLAAQHQPPNYLFVDNGSEFSGRQLDDVALCVAPGICSATIHGTLIAQCAHRGDRFAIVDAPDTLDVAGILGFGSDSIRGSRRFITPGSRWLTRPLLAAYECRHRATSQGYTLVWIASEAFTRLRSMKRFKASPTSALSSRRLTRYGSMRKASMPFAIFRAKAYTYGARTLSHDPEWKEVASLF